jgi:hypothetical protein
MEMKRNRTDIGESEAWVHSAEPIISKIDNWGRRAIPVKKIIRHAAAAASTVTMGSDQKSISTRSRITVGSRRYPTKVGTGLANLPEETEKGPQPLTDVSIREIPEEEEILRSRKEVELKRRRDEVEIQK